MLRKEAGLKVQLHRTSPRTHHMSSNFQTKQKLNQKASLRKESGSKPQLHRTSPKTHHTSSNFHIKQKPNQGNSLGKVGMKTQPHRIIGPLGLLTLRDLMDCALPQQDKPQETHLEPVLLSKELGRQAARDYARGVAELDGHLPPACAALHTAEIFQW